MLLSLSFGLRMARRRARYQRASHRRSRRAARDRAGAAKTRDRKNPYEGEPDALLAGKKLYLQHCAECHGTNARGMRKPINLRTPQVQNATPGELVWFLRNGNLFRGMPSWSGLPEQRRWQIVTYLKSLR